LRTTLIGVEASLSRFDLMKRNCQDNLIPSDQLQLHRAACTVDGAAVFIPCNDDFGAAVTRLASGPAEEVPGIRLADLISSRVDFLDVDIQGAELEVIPANVALLDETVALAHVGTHSAAADDIIARTFAKHGWRQRQSFPCWQFNQTPYGAFHFIDGIQSWENPRL
jgi:FkbM family methyltransferase